MAAKFKFIDNNSSGGIYLEEDKIMYNDGDEVILVSGDDNDQRPIRCGEFLSFLKNQSYLTGGIKYINTLDIPENGESIYDKSFYYRNPKDIDSEIPRIDILDYPGKESIIKEIDGMITVFPPEGDIKVCDSWDSRRLRFLKGTLNEIYDSRIGLEKPGEEIFNNISSRYTHDYYSDNYSMVYDLLTFSSRDYTNQIDIRQYIEKSTLSGISGKLDITIEYGVATKLHISYFSFTAFSYSDGVLVNDPRIFKTHDIQGEYLNGVFTVYPISSEVGECIISDCILSYGKLEEL